MKYNIGDLVKYTSTIFNVYHGMIGVVVTITGTQIEVKWNKLPHMWFVKASELVLLNKAGMLK